MRMGNLLVIVLIVDEDCVLILKLERQSPVPADADRPVILELSSEPMQPPSRSIQVSRLACIIEGEQL